MKRFAISKRLLLASTASILLSGCMAAPLITAIPQLAGMMKKPEQAADAPVPSTSGTDSVRVGKKAQLAQSLMNEPQTPAWAEEMRKLAAASGERVYDRPMEEVYAQIAAALPSVPVQVNSADPARGLITAGVPRLPADKAAEVQLALMQSYCEHNGYDKSLLIQQGPGEPDLNAALAMSRSGQVMAIGFVKESEGKTRVRIRFLHVNYPGEAQEYYKAAWAAIDGKMTKAEGVASSGQ